MGTNGLAKPFCGSHHRLHGLCGGHGRRYFNPAPQRRLARLIRTWWFIAVGLVNGAAVLLLYLALNRGSVTIVAPLVGCYPLLTLILGRLFLGESIPTRFALAGTFITVAGVGLLLMS